jgi:hypothetical protein
MLDNPNERLKCCMLESIYSFKKDARFQKCYDQVKKALEEGANPNLIWNHEDQKLHFNIGWRTPLWYVDLCVECDKSLGMLLFKHGAIPKKINNYDGLEIEIYYGKNITQLYNNTVTLKLLVASGELLPTDLVRLLRNYIL